MFGSKLQRLRWCKWCKKTCPVHVLGKFFAGLPIGTKPFAGLSPSKALANLRRILSELGIPRASEYRTHDLRRGHADDIAKSGGRLIELLQMGEWADKSGAYLSYLDNMRLEAEAVVNAHGTEDASSDEEAVELAELLLSEGDGVK